jgi:3-dehydroquinate synthase
MLDKVKLRIIEKNDFSYEIVIGENLIQEIVIFLKKTMFSNKLLIITDSNIKKIYGKTLLKQFKKNNLKAELISFKAGEDNKTRKTKQEIENKMLELGLGRDTVIISFGGGVVGDLAGFIAATFNRGIPYVQVPTSLLAMIDSSIGGKTAVDTKYGKNLIGAFYQPIKVYIDINFLQTLPKEEVLNGLAELIKHGIIMDKELFYFMEKYNKEILNKDKEILTYLIKESCKIKSEIVEKDEKETGLRQILNFGHTIAHAIEKVSDYKLKHGSGVSIGMCVEAKISNKLNFLEDYDYTRIVQLLKSFKLPTKIPSELTYKKIINAAKLDKKSRLGIPRFVLLKEIGKVRKFQNKYSFQVDEKIIKKSVKECKKLK